MVYILQLDTERQLEAWGSSGGGTTPPPSIPFFKIAGQSNAQGLARRSDLYSATLNTASPSFTRQFNTRIWNPTANALQRLQVGTAGKTGSGGGNELGQQGSEHPSDYEDGFGPEIGFAQRLEQQNISTAVLAKFGRGATAIARWQKAAGDLYPLLKATIVNARAAVVAGGNTPQELGLYWDQWETDGNSSTYQTDLQQFYNDLKADGLVGASEKFVVCAAQNNTILSQQQAFVNANPAAVLLTPASIAYIPNDNLHYDARTQLAIGGNSLYNLLYNTTGSINIPAPAAVISSKLLSLRSYSSGNTVSQWNDLSDKGNHLTQPDASRQMQLVTGLNGKMAYRMTSNSFFLMPVVSPDPVEYTIVLAFDPSSADQAFLLDFLGNPTSDRFVLSYFPDGTTGPYSSTGGSFFNFGAFKGPNISGTDLIIASFVFRVKVDGGDNARVYPNRGASGIATDYGAIRINGYGVLGKAADGDQAYFKGDFYAVDITRGALSDADRQAIVDEIYHALVP